MRLNLTIETARGTQHEIDAEVTNHGNGNKYLEADDGRGFKLYEDGRVMEACKGGLSGQVVAGRQVA